MSQAAGRKPNHAGTKYPSDPKELQTLIQSILLKSKPDLPTDGKIIFAPSGTYDDMPELYANAYAPLKGKKVDLAIVVAFSASEFFNFISIYNGDEYITPLGSLKVDSYMRDELADEDDDLYSSDKGHSNKDPFIELQLPFLQTVLEPGFKLVPMIVGNQSQELCDELVNALSELTASRNVVIVFCGEATHSALVIPELIEKNFNDLLTTIETQTNQLFKLRNNRQLFEAGSFGLYYAAKLIAHNLGFKKMSVQGVVHKKTMLSHVEHTTGYCTLTFSRS